MSYMLQVTSWRLQVAGWHVSPPVPAGLRARPILTSGGLPGNTPVDATRNTQ